MITKNIKRFLLAVTVCCGFVTGLTSCSDEPDSEYFYTFNTTRPSPYI